MYAMYVLHACIHVYLRFMRVASCYDILISFVMHFSFIYCLSFIMHFWFHSCIYCLSFLHEEFSYQHYTVTVCLAAYAQVMHSIRMCQLLVVVILVSCVVVCFASSELTCAPFFGGDSCECESSYYNGILKCVGNRAYIIRGYWAGVCENNSLCTANCPYGFCSYNDSTDYRLPTSISDLDDYICGPTRTGVLCGECRTNYSVTYHSYSRTCAHNDSCKYGWLLYIVSELIPLAIVFFLVTAFNISFTSGDINGFILFAQLYDSLAVHGNGLIQDPQKSFYVFIYKLMYRFFNFDFFAIDELSFCLWEGATTLDVIAFKYVTVVFALILVLICVYVMNSTRIKRTISFLKPTKLRTTMIHGLTAFFVMCYSQCARSTLHIFISMDLYYKGPVYAKTVVFRSGQLSLFEPTHLKYAIPAIFFSSTLLFFPPVVLILYPLLWKILARCNLSETKVVNCISRLIPMQLLDSFQSSFRDEARYFSGLYFLYRAIPLIIFTTSLNLPSYYISLELFLIFILVVHIVIQPYKKRIHNIVDALLFANLASINALSLFNYQKAVQGLLLNLDLFDYFLVYFWIQQILIYLPLVALLLVGLFKVSRMCAAKCCKEKCLSRKKRELQRSESFGLPPLREELLGVQSKSSD